MTKTGRFLVAIALGAIGSGLSGCTWMSGCGAAQEGAPTPGTTTAEIAVAQDLIGAYHAQGATTLPLRGLRLSRDQKDGSPSTFFAERAVTCDEGTGRVRLEGTWRVQAGSQLELTLPASRGEPSVKAPPVTVLRYRYTLQGSTMRLYDGSVQVAELQKTTTFCMQASDCVSQTIIRPQCVGNAVCTAAQTCGWACGAAQPGASFGDPCGGIAGLRCAPGLRCAAVDERGCVPKLPPPDATGVCLTGDGAPADDPCVGFRCVIGEHCSAAGGQASCVADDPALCAAVQCGTAQPHCVGWPATGETACLAPDACHRDGDCQGSQRCQAAAACVRAPCFQPLNCQ